MSLGTTITLIGVVFIIYYSLTQILNFYGVNPSAYDVYYYFYAFIFLSALVLTTEEPSF